MLRGGLADVTPLESEVIDEGPQRVVTRYRTEEFRAARRRRRAGERQVVLLVPPLAAPAFVFDMRRGCSVAEHQLEQGRDVYLVDYGQVAFADRALGLEHWVDEVLPSAIRGVSTDAGGRPVHLIGWCLGGTLCALTVAADAKLPVASITMVATPIDATRLPFTVPLRLFYDLTGGAIVTAAYRAFGIVPAPLVKLAFQLMTFDRYATRPLRVLQNLDDRDYLEQVETLNRLMDNMIAYPGRTLGQLFHDLFRANKLASGRVELGGDEIDLHTIKQPLLCVAGEDDGIAPAASAHHIGQIVPQAQLRIAPGGHVGVIAGTTARDTTWRMIDEFLDEQPSVKRPAGRSSRATGRARASGTAGA